MALLLRQVDLSGAVLPRVPPTEYSWPGFSLLFSRARRYKVQIPDSSQQGSVGGNIIPRRIYVPEEFIRQGTVSKVLDAHKRK